MKIVLNQSEMVKILQEYIEEKGYTPNSVNIKLDNYDADYGDYDLIVEFDV